MRKVLLALALIAGSLGSPAGFLVAPGWAQAPPPVPAEPDTERRTRYTGVSSVTTFSVGFDVYGDGTDYQNWVEVWVNGANIPASGNWSMVPVSGSFTTLSRPMLGSNLNIVFTNAQTGTVDIVGARRPRRMSQLGENRGVTARDFNQLTTDLWMTVRERWDRASRTVMAPPGETLSSLPPAATRANGSLGFNASGDLTVIAGTLSGATVSSVMVPVVTASTLAAARSAMGADNASNLNNGTLPTAQLPAIPIANLPQDSTTWRTAVANDTILNTDCGKTVMWGTGATGFFVGTLPAVTGFPTGCRVSITNGDTGRTKGLSGFPTGALPRLWPKQTIVVKIVSGAWTIEINPGRYRPNVSTFTMNVNHGLGSDSATVADGLATGSGAFATIQNCGNVAYTELDLNGGTTPKCLNAAETFTENNVFFQGQMTGRNVLQIAGAGMGSSTWNCSSGIALGDKDNAELQVDGFTMRNTGTCGPFFFQEGGGAIIDIAQNAPIDFGALSNQPHIQVAAPGTVNINPPYTISGGASAHIFYVGTGAAVNVAAGTVTMPNAITVSNAFYQGILGSSLNSAGVTYTGAGAGAGTTGKTYALTYCATAALSGSTIPGATAGTATCTQAP